MALAPFFERVYGAVGGHLAVSRESLTSALEKVTVGINCGTECARNDFWIAELVTNLAARLYPRIAISGPDSQTQQLKQLATSINPHLELEENAPGFSTVSISEPRVSEALFPSASGWVARLGHSGIWRSGPDNPYSSGVAACLACAELFRRIFLNSSPEKDVEISILDFGASTGTDLELKSNDLGDVAFAGVGAVGNAAIWALMRDERLTGHLWLIDPEDLTLFNLQRYVLGTTDDVSRSKVLLAKEMLANTHIRVEACQTSLEQFADARGSFDIPTICITVDNINSRRSAQALLPKLIVNGWTGEQALGASWHLLTRDVACLACLYHPHGQGLSATEQAARALGLSQERATLLWVTRQPLTEEDFNAVALHLGVDGKVLGPWQGKSLGDLYTDVVCGAVPIDVTGVGRVETVPLAHQSALAGILTAAELVKRTNSQLSEAGQDEPLVSWDNVLKPPPQIWTKPRARELGCICRDSDYQSVYKAKWGIAQSSISPA